MRKKILLMVLVVIILGVVVGGGILYRRLTKQAPVPHAQAEEKVPEIDKFLDQRREEQLKDEQTDPFGEDQLVRVLFIGLDNRTGKTVSNCDSIQFITINKQTKTVQILAVPRGTYAPLPGTGHLSTDYYVSKSCSVGGLEYGIQQMERIAGLKADYVVMVGFSETMGILRNLKLPATETLQWLRHRQGYAIGEPQRARNHSTFIKQLMQKYLPKDNSALDVPWEYILYKLVHTDLSFSEARTIVNELIGFDLANHPEKITLSMRPAHNVQDIPYDPDHVNEYLKSMLDPIKHLLSKDDYGEITKEQAEKRIVDLIENNKTKPEFIVWAFENAVWYQVNDDTKRESLRYEITTQYALSLLDKEKREQILADYILEMDYLGLNDWSQRAKDFLEKELAN